MKYIFHYFNKNRKRGSKILKTLSKNQINKSILKSLIKKNNNVLYCKIWYVQSFTIFCPYRKFRISNKTEGTIILCDFIILFSPLHIITLFYFHKCRNCTLYVISRPETCRDSNQNWKLSPRLCRCQWEASFVFTRFFFCNFLRFLHSISKPRLQHDELRISVHTFRKLLKPDNFLTFAL